MTPKAKNECRKLASNITNALALGIAALGVLRPIFDPGVDFDALNVGLATLGSFALWGLAFYFLSSLEDEE